MGYKLSADVGLLRAGDSPFIVPRWRREPGDLLGQTFPEKKNLTRTVGIQLRLLPQKSPSRRLFNPNCLKRS
ncbi:hypothetical protein P691DRAFT_806388 [Macrolepiota fuliginosa MF-IS2]|uniref:Uncharacterized protein n=1 Tax=Macrolepiota fuliginosa MF-IS2 TaxID=1400762 RepID=A0A9P5X5P3_9AGAR|nr:hypothetical protein P691DRAFT_806388 [Macrolepiota fuliginosa MF-IS2]